MPAQDSVGDVCRLDRRKTVSGMDAAWLAAAPHRVVGLDGIGREAARAGWSRRPPSLPAAPHQDQESELAGGSK